MPTETGSRPSPPQPQEADRDRLLQRFQRVRAFTDQLREPLSAEDCVVQSCFEASPVKWHLAHTTWFFEVFALRPHDPAYRPFSDRFDYLFNSYYNAVGDRQPKEHRGIVTRPGLDETLRYRDHVDRAVRRLIERCDAEQWAQVWPILEIGTHHEQQHQELILTDIKHLFASNPLQPAYRSDDGSGNAAGAGEAGEMRWIAFDEGLRRIGHDGDGFAYDNEGPRHRVFLEPFEIADRPVTNAEYQRFIEDGGYERPELWLDEGWATVQQRGWQGPLYWETGSSVEPSCYTLAGSGPVRPDEPVSHVSFYEAEAFARWAGARLPTEQEWETACAELPVEGNLVESGRLHPAPAPDDGDDGGGGIRQPFGDVWEWTRSAYEPYPGYRPPAGALGEYNGKFMCSQYVLRGGSCATPGSHIRSTYRNFFHPHVRWQFSGIRLARDPS